MVTRVLPVSARGLVGLMLCSLQLLPPTLASRRVAAAAPTVSPADDIIMLRLGDPLEIFCYAENTYTADDLLFRTFESKLPLTFEMYNDTTIRYFEKKPERGLSYLSCRNRRKGTQRLIKVLIDSPPANVTEFTCRSLDLVQLTCWWTTSRENMVDIHFDLTLMKNKEKIALCVPKRMEEARYECILFDRVTPGWRRWAHKTLFFVLTSTNVFGSTQQNFTIYHPSILQPSAIRRVKLKAVTPHSAELEWRTSRKIHDFCPMTAYKIEYNIPKIDIFSHFRRVNASNSPSKSRLCRVLLSRLPFANTEYSVRVSIRPVEATGDLYWSEPTALTFRTSGKTPKEIEAIVYNWSRSINKPRLHLAPRVWRMKAPTTDIRRWLAIQNGVASYLDHPSDLSWYLDDKSDNRNGQ